MTRIIADTRELHIAYSDQQQAIAVELAPHSSLFETARDLYLRGLNVFPIPRRPEVEAATAAGATYKGRPYDPDRNKPPYLLEPLYTARLHFCTRECGRYEKRTGLACLKPAERPDKLFANANLAVMTGRTSQNLLALDCDTPEAAAAVQSNLTGQGLQYWAYSTYRGAIFLLRLIEGEAANNPRPPIPGLEIWGRLHYVVLPPSAHPQGVIYQWLTPEPFHHLGARDLPQAVAAEALAELGVSLHKTGGLAPDLQGLPGWAVHLSAANRAILANGSPQGQRNTDLTKAAYDLAANVLTGTVEELEALTVLEAAADKCSPAYDLASVASLWRAALKATPSPAKTFHGPRSQPKQSNYTGLAAWANSYRWPGRTGQTDRAAFLACIERARLDQGEPFRASVREIAELANMTHKTATKALQRLAGRSAGKTPQLLTKATPDHRSGANKYRFAAPAELPTPPARETCISTPLIPLVCSGVDMHARKPIPLTPAEQDLFGRLGLIAWRAWTYLIDHPAGTFAEIGRAIGCDPSSVSRAIQKQLIPRGLVARAEGQLYGELKTEADLERLAAGVGWKVGTEDIPALGRSAKRKRRHERERQRRINASLARARAKWQGRYKQWASKSKN